MSKINLYRTEIDTCGGAMESDTTRYSNYRFVPTLTRNSNKKIIVQEKFKVKSSTDDKTCGTCGEGTCGVENLDPILDPRFNLRETAKQLCLLETHLNLPLQRCADCIRKHSITIEGLIDEGIGLDKQHEYTKTFADTRSKYKEIILPFLRKLDAKTCTDKDYLDTAQQLRSVRKPLAIYASFC